MTLTRGHISKVKSTVYTYPKSVSWSQLFTVKLDRDGDDIIVVHDTGVVVAGDALVNLEHDWFPFEFFVNYLFLATCRSIHKTCTKEIKHYIHQ